MTIILFLIDTSASMCQRAHVNGVQKSYLDIAKGAVETFLKYRQRSQDCMGDRYMLLSFEDPPSNVKAGWKENHATFMNELKNLQSTGLTSMGEALKNAFDLLNLNRMQSGIDTYGQGRCPFYLETSVIIVITDGGKYSSRNGVHNEIVLPLHAQIPGTKLTKEPFRWDQRLFSLVLRMAGNKVDERVDGKVPHDDSPIEKMCEVTGGRSYRVKSHYVLNQCIESLVQKVQPGVVVHFDQLAPKDLKDGEVQDIAFQTTKKMIYVQKHPSQKTYPVGYWPIPEPYWPDPKALSLPPRDAHPKIRIVTPCIDEPQMVRNFPIDKYELEASPLTLQILSKRETTKCWSVIVSGMHSSDAPFGYLKANATFTQVYLMVLPYNYPVLLPLLGDLFHKYNSNPPNDWIYKFSNYVRNIPQYYCPFLRRALGSASVPYQLLQYIIPENLDSYLSPAVANYLKNLKNTAKQDQENLCVRVFKQLKQPKPAYHQMETVKLNCGQQLRRDLVSHPMLRDTFSKIHSDISIYENYTIVIPTAYAPNSPKNYRNPFDIPRKELIDEIARMRENFFKLPTTGISVYTKDAGHCLPISEMGNYQEYLKNKETPLREIEPTNVRQHMFGNPYKKDKHMVMVDEADLGDVAPMKPNTPMTKKVDGKMTRKRKAGPISKDYKFRRMSTGSRHSAPAALGGMMSDSEDETLSEVSSVVDDPDEQRLIVDFEFNEPPTDDFPINGHVQSFINGEIEDPEDIGMPLMALPPANGPPATAPVPPQSPATPAVAPPSIIVHHNDINDAQEISKILQQCHNGNDSRSIFHDRISNVEVEQTPRPLDIFTNHKIAEVAEIPEATITTIPEITIKPEPPELDEEQKENIRQANLETRTMIFRDIRRPGRDYSLLLEHLNLVKGNFETKFNFVQMCINESMRFRRKRMADSIQEWWERQIDKLESNPHLNC
ncbi:integrator complex subunit 6 [Phlebotomus papatasi]|uniref:integrator complex subunit 6 n=1 Tax=Phlebotomus papatasi TaxID=29031 RepID=UPI0024840FC6|nr:integrator complex subunit 6 [Phlebotomus papatasi]